MSEEKKTQVNSEAGQQLFSEFVNQLSEMYKTKKIIMFGVVEPEAGTSAQPQIVLAAHGTEEINFREFSFQLFRMIGKISNLNDLAILRQATVEVKNQKDNSAGENKDVK